jgi:hypothetical protein
MQHIEQDEWFATREGMVERVYAATADEPRTIHEVYEAFRGDASENSFEMVEFFNVGSVVEHLCISGLVVRERRREGNLTRTAFFRRLASDAIPHPLDSDARELIVAHYRAAEEAVNAARKVVSAHFTPLVRALIAAGRLDEAYCLALECPDTVIKAFLFDALRQGGWVPEARR